MADFTTKRSIRGSLPFSKTFSDFVGIVDIHCTNTCVILNCHQFTRGDFLTAVVRGLSFSPRLSSKGNGIGLGRPTSTVE